MKLTFEKGKKRYWWCKFCEKFTWQDKVHGYWECRECD